MPSKVTEVSMSTAKPYVRKRYFIKKGFQKRFISEYILLTLLGIVMANLLLYTLLIKGIDNAFYRAHIGITTTSEVVLSPLFFTAIVVIALVVAAVLVTTVVNTWKVRKRLHCLAEGIHGIEALDLTVRIKLCHGDQLTAEVTDIFNKAVKHLNKKMGSIKSGICDLETTALSNATDKAGALEQLLVKVKSIEDDLSSFKLSQ